MIRSIDGMVDRRASPRTAGDAPDLPANHWSDGGDGIVVRENVKTVADLRDKKLVLAQNSPSQYFALNMLVAGACRDTFGAAPVFPTVNRVRWLRMAVQDVHRDVRPEPAKGIREGVPPNGISRLCWRTPSKGSCLTGRKTPEEIACEMPLPSSSEALKLEWAALIRIRSDDDA